MLIRQKTVVKTMYNFVHHTKLQNLVDPYLDDAVWWTSDEPFITWFHINAPHPALVTAYYLFNT